MNTTSSCSNFRTMEVSPAVQLLIFKNMHVSLWVNGFDILSQELQGLLSYTNSTLILWSQLMELLKRYSEDIPEVGLEIVLKSDETAELVTTLCASTERENSYNFITEQLNLYFVCHITIIYIKQIQLLLHFKYNIKVPFLLHGTTTVTLFLEYYNVTGYLVQSSSNSNCAYLSTLGNVREGDLFGGVKHEYATHPRALECSACFSPH